MVDKTMLVNDLITQLKYSNIPNAKQEMYFFCNELLHLNRSDMLLLKEFTNKQAKILKNAVKQRCNHVPLQLIVGRSSFMGLTILENKETLTPRPETELLASIIIDEYKNTKAQILDMCSGSGCIGIALGKNGHNVTCVDVNNKALKSTKKNAQLNKVKVNLIKSDMFTKVKGTFDIIVSNPPYIPTKEIFNLQPEVKNYDPIIALDGGVDGFHFYKVISDQAHNYLKPNGVLYLECGKDQAQTIKKLLSKNFKNITIIKDYNSIERFIKAEVK